MTRKQEDTALVLVWGLALAGFGLLALLLGAG